MVAENHGGVTFARILYLCIYSLFFFIWKSKTIEVTGKLSEEPLGRFSDGFGFPHTVLL